MTTNDNANVWAVKLYAAGRAPELVYVVAPDAGEASRLAWAKLETITGVAPTGNRWSLVALVKGIEDGTTKGRISNGR